MSGTPNTTQAEELANALLEIDRIDTETRISEDKTKALALHIQKMQEERTDAFVRVKKLLDSMDCASPGNNGYERRMLALLTLLAYSGRP